MSLFLSLLILRFFSLFLSLVIMRAASKDVVAVVCWCNASSARTPMSAHGSPGSEDTEAPNRPRGPWMR